MRKLENAAKRSVSPGDTCVNTPILPMEARRLSHSPTLFQTADSSTRTSAWNFPLLELRRNLTVSAASGMTAVTVPVMVSGASTAQSTTDYSLSSNFIIIPAGDSSGSVSLSVVAPTAYEKSKMVFLSLGTPSNARLGGKPYGYGCIG